MDSHLKNNLAIIATIGIMAIVIIAMSVIAYNLVIKESPESPISTTGTAQIKVMPDIVGIYYNVETNGTTAADAGAKNAEISNNLAAELMKLGFARSDLQTESYNIYPDYIWVYDYPTELVPDAGKAYNAMYGGGRQVQNGFKASHQLKLEFSTEDTGLIGDAIDAGIKVGATINNINFELSVAKQNEYKTEALKVATDDAQAQAKAVADGLGKSLGRVISVSSSDFGYSPWRLYDAITLENVAYAKPVATSIQPSDKEVNAQVSVTYAIE